MPAEGGHNRHVGLVRHGEYGLEWSERITQQQIQHLPGKSVPHEVQCPSRQLRMNKQRARGCFTDGISTSDVDGRKQDGGFSEFVASTTGMMYSHSTAGRPVPAQAAPSGGAMWKRG
ncbi:hypothetical protein K474DRAFT_1655091 [Panus rudis PR-1116 ss-1]|nr:hypothetical protein K474DRAFT_1660498 [Panus rudis PR-1116 ss-1]KAI0082351.1 hypothetical protein K474DRAFT_1655091 [Panus rudis PR-1116 ss-1]